VNDSGVPSERTWRASAKKIAVIQLYCHLESFSNESKVAIAAAMLLLAAPPTPITMIRLNTMTNDTFTIL
jgi:hypothetical protein